MNQNQKETKIGVLTYFTVFREVQQHELILKLFFGGWPLAAGIYPAISP
jgi:hypothetical protein